MVDATATDHSALMTPPARQAQLCVSLVHHPDPALIGASRALEAAAPLVLGRGADALGAGRLDEKRLSRRHAELSLRSGKVRLRDLGSRNGTTLNGAPVTEATLEEGDVIGVGGLLLLVHRGEPRAERSTHPTMCGVSAAMGDALVGIAKAARQDINVLIVGETGTGKELAARELHRQSGRAGAFVAFDCASVAPGVVQSELFGHLKGAYTGAETRRRGVVEQARGGTLFLDEVGDATAALQAALLRLLETRTFRAVGSSETRRADARFVAATLHRVDQPGAASGFREDLAARLAGWVVHLPPLRARREDIPHLAMHLGAQRAGRPVRFDRAAMLRLLRHDWPRNVRGLKAAVDRLVIEGGGESVLRLASLADPEGWLGPAADEDLPEATRGRGTNPGARALREALARHGGNVKAVAKVLGTSRTSLYKWIKDAGLDLDEVRRR